MLLCHHKVKKKIIVYRTLFWKMVKTFMRKWMTAVCICVFVAPCMRVLFFPTSCPCWVVLALNFCQRQSQNPAHTVTGPDLALLTTTIHIPVQWLGSLSRRSGTPSDTRHPHFRDVVIAGTEVIFQVWNDRFHGRCFIRKKKKKLDRNSALWVSASSLWCHHTLWLPPTERCVIFDMPEPAFCFGVQFTNKRTPIKHVSDGRIKQ